MPSEHTSIDEFFLKKEEEWTLPGSHEDAHWQQMKTMLPGSPLPDSKRREIIRRRIIGYTGGFITITVITTIVVLSLARSSKNNSVAGAKTAAHITTPASKRPAKPSTATVVPKPGPALTVATTPATTTASHAAQPVPHSRPATTQRIIPPGTASAPRTTYRQSITSDTVTTIIPVKTSPDAAELLGRFYSQLQQSPQEFTIRPQWDTLLVGKEGTRIFIPSHVFESKTGKPVTGPVKIVLEEFYSYDKMIAAGLSTRSGKEQLVSGGMLHIMAFADGHELRIQPAMNLTVKMPTNNYDGRMQLFTGNASPKGATSANKFIDAAQVSFHTEDTASTDIPGAPGDKAIDWMAMGQLQQTYKRPDLKIKDFRNQPAASNTSTAVFYLHRAPGNDKEAIKEELEKRYGYYYDKIKVRYVNRLLHPKLFRANLTGDTVSLSFDEAIKNKLLSPADSLDYINRITADSIVYFSQTKGLKEYTFNVSNLGWINCDRFARDPRPKVEFTINLGPHVNASLFRAQLIFARYQSLVPAFYHDNRMSCGNIPAGEPVRLVCIGVKEGKVMSCIESLTTSDKEVSDLRWEETTPEQFKAKLKALNLVSQ